LLSTAAVVALAQGAGAQSSSWFAGDYPVTQPYGCTREPAEPVIPKSVNRSCPSNAPRWHQGIDIALPCGTPLKAPAALTVVRIGDGRSNATRGLGPYYPTVRLRGYDVMLGHAQQPVVVRAGQQLAAGETIAYSGGRAGTGATSGCHLHFEVHTAGGTHWQWNDVDPSTLLTLRAPTRPKEQRRSGPVQASLYYTQTGSYTYSDVRVQIARAGQAIVDEAVPPYRPAYNSNVEPAWPVHVTWTKRHSLTVRDLDADGEPEVMVELTWGGAHHATWSRVYRYDRAKRHYLASVHFWGDPNFKLKQLNRERRPEWVSADVRFQGRFACSACSGLPLQIWAYRAGLWHDVTRAFPALIASDAARYWRSYLSARDEAVPGGNVRGVLAAWAADEELLGRHHQVLAALEHARRRGDLALGGTDDDVWGTPSAYIQRLLRFLRKAGYIHA
jgi:murein DD-endopeptidase MepM/ murein hydrolase activator NlpD